MTFATRSTSTNSTNTIFDLMFPTMSDTQVKSTRSLASNVLIRLAHQDDTNGDEYAHAVEVYNACNTELEKRDGHEYGRCPVAMPEFKSSSIYDLI